MPAKCTSSPKRNPDPHALDLHEVIEYGKSKGIGVILYVNQQALERQLDEILPLYEKWGVKGVKFGFVNVGSQRWTRWLHEAIRKAAPHRLMVDIHDEFRNMGYQRTYPNLMTVEGIGGNEEFPTPVHNATLPFTRFLTGPADYTFCWYSGKLQPTHAHQLAISTIFFSPWQFLYWYDRPAMYKGEAGAGLLEGLADRLGRNPRAQGRDRQVRVGRAAQGQRVVCRHDLPARRTAGNSAGISRSGREIHGHDLFGPAPGASRSSKEVTDRDARASIPATVLRVNISANGGQAVRIVPRDRRRPNEARQRRAVRASRPAACQGCTWSA